MSTTRLWKSMDTPSREQVSATPGSAASTPISTISVADRAPVIAASRLRKGSTGSPKGASRLVGDTPATLRRLRSKDATGRVLLRAGWTRRQVHRRWLFWVLPARG